MCKLIENHCQILKIENSWPVEFNCENETIYPPKPCKVHLHLQYLISFIKLTVYKLLIINTLCRMIYMI